MYIVLVISALLFAAGMLMLIFAACKLSAECDQQMNAMLESHRADAASGNEVTV